MAAVVYSRLFGQKRSRKEFQVENIIWVKVQTEEYPSTSGDCKYS